MTLRIYPPGSTTQDAGDEQIPPGTITAGGGGGVNTQDEGIAVDTPATTLNFVGDGVTATGGAGTTTVTINGAGQIGSQFNWGDFIAGRQTWPCG